jgi:hypothetical protein
MASVEHKAIKLLTIYNKVRLSVHRFQLEPFHLIRAVWENVLPNSCPYPMISVKDKTKINLSLFKAVTHLRLVGTDRCFGTDYRFHLQGFKDCLALEDVTSKLSRNVGKWLPIDAVWIPEEWKTYLHRSVSLNSRRSQRISLNNRSFIATIWFKVIPADPNYSVSYHYQICYTSGFEPPFWI